MISEPLIGDSEVLRVHEEEFKRKFVFVYGFSSPLLFVLQVMSTGKTDPMVMLDSRA
jgi:hypothetical protein